MVWEKVNNENRYSKVEISIIRIFDLYIFDKNIIKFMDIDFWNRVDNDLKKIWINLNCCKIFRIDIIIIDIDKKILFHQQRKKIEKQRGN